MAGWLNEGWLVVWVVVICQIYYCFGTDVWDHLKNTNDTDDQRITGVDVRFGRNITKH